MIRILLAEDQRMIRDLLARLLELEPDLEVVAQVSSGDRVVAAARESRADVALLDIKMPDIDGLSAAEELARTLPACRIVMLTSFSRTGYVQRAIEAGARGFLAKDSPAHELADAIRRVMQGQLVLAPDLAAASLSMRCPLSRREGDVLAAAADGEPVGDLARRLHLSEGTVRNYLSAAIVSTGARNRMEAVRIARQHGWV